MSRGPLRDGDTVVLVDAKGRRHLKSLRSGHRITIRGSIVRADDLIGCEEGAVAGEPERFIVLRPTCAELTTLVERPAEPIFAKDVGAIVTRADLGAGMSVVEVGVGAGLLSIALLRILGPQGCLTSYEIRNDFARLARENVGRYYGRPANWRLVVADAAAGIDTSGADAVILDVPEPDRIVPAAARALRYGGTLAVYLPNVPQVERLREVLSRGSGFGLVETIEVFERPWLFEGASVRPAHRMVAHTAFLTFARRLPD
ncbi:MAG: tRNA (adenine-N1)-methyltransferase [Deltaproteobacteria bacterium]|nr:MAG: tRNA (adenine-N1)-methyltransferase [Deltaproteobacteria bacterium]